MRKNPAPVYLTPSQIEDRIREREADAAELADGDERRAILKEIARLRLYADAKRWLESPGLKPAV
jgi:hypothetical protein